MPRNSTPQRRIEGIAWRPGAWVTESESGAIIPPEALPPMEIASFKERQARYAIELTMVTIARAMVIDPPKDAP